MAKNKRQQKAKSASQKDRNEQKPPVPLTNEPWLGQKTGLTMIGMLSIGMFIYMVWQLHPTEGWGNAFLWGLGFAVGIWAIFGISLSFNMWLRKRGQGGR